MSVAFRRESDEEHLEPKFERPIPPGPNLVTTRGLARIEACIAKLEAEVAAGGDETTQAERQRDLRYWRARHATARPTPPPAGEEAGFGSRVTYRLKGGAARTIEIVGADEADPAEARLAFTAPLAQAMIGAAKGDRVDFGGEEEALEIVAVGAP